MTDSTPETQLQSRFDAFSLGANAQGLPQVLGLVNGVPYAVANQRQDATWNVTGSALPNTPNKTYQALATVNFNNVLQVLALGTDGQLYLPCYQDSAGGWRAGRAEALPNSTGKTFLAFRAVIGHQGHLEVLGLGNDHLLYHPCWRNGDAWIRDDVQYRLHNGPTSFSAFAVSSVYNPGNSGDVRELQVLGLSRDDKCPWWPCKQSEQGYWVDSGSLYPLSHVPMAGLQSLVPAGDANMVGLGTDGKPYLTCWRGGSGWNQGISLFPEGSTRTYQSLHAALSASSRAFVVGVGASDQRPYLVALQNKTKTWDTPALALPDLPRPDGTPRTYQSLALIQGSTGLVVVGLETDGTPWLVSWREDSNDNPNRSEQSLWHPGLPLDAPPEWVYVEPGQFGRPNSTTGDFSMTVSPGTGAGFVLSNGRNVVSELKVFIQNTQEPTDALFGPGTSSFFVYPGGPTYQLVQPLGSGNTQSAYTLTADKVTNNGGHGGRDVMNGDVVVVQRKKR